MAFHILPMELCRYESMTVVPGPLNGMRIDPIDYGHADARRDRTYYAPGGCSKFDVLMAGFRQWPDGLV
jgi:hypothetical protein